MNVDVGNCNLWNSYYCCCLVHKDERPCLCLCFLSSSTFTCGCCCLSVVG